MVGVGSRRPSGLQSFREIGRRLAVLIAITAVVVGCGGPAPSAPPVPTSTPQSSPAAAASATTAPSGGAPTASAPAGDGTWTAVTPTGLPQVATLTPTKRSGDAVARTSAFLLTALDGRPAGDVAKELVVQPAVEFRVTQAPSGVLLQPTKPLAAATRYHFSLGRPDGTVAATWTATTAGPLHITDTVPGDKAVQVPTDTGIELDFDQSGVTAQALTSHLSITPATTGHVEVRGRALAFVPDRQLRTGTLYTVTVSRGLLLGETGESLASDRVIRFETAATQATRGRIWLADALVDASPRERASLTVWLDIPEGATTPTSVPLTVHRLGGLDQAIAAWQAVENAPDWTLASTARAVPTAKLQLVLSAKARIEHTADGTTWLQLSRSLGVGWYVVTVTYADVPRQLVLQVTDTATYALVTTTRTAVWVNDLRSGKPVRGATAVLGGASLTGSTDANGLLNARTPAKVAAGDVVAPLLLVHASGSTTFRPINTENVCAKCGWGPAGVVSERFWTLLTTDRTQYRQTDTVHVVGVVRDRASGTVPGQVQVSLYRNEDDGSAGGLAVLSRTASPDSRGMYSASLPIASLPSGGYWIRATVGAETVGEAWLDVAVIRKPAYTITVTTDRHAIVTGSSVRTSVAAAFFEGTPVAGDAIALRANGDAPLATSTTDSDGRLVATVHPTISGSLQEVVQIVANPVQPEEAQISGVAQIMVFPGKAVVSLQGAATAKTVTVTGAVNSIDWARYETPTAAMDVASEDPRGAARSGAAVRLDIVANYEELRQVGTEYDFITKRVVPRFEAIPRTDPLPSRTVRTRADGTFRLVVPTAHGAYGYEVTATYVDEDGHSIATQAWASSDDQRLALEPASLQPDAAHRAAPEYRIGEMVTVRFAGGVPHPTASRFLYVTLHQGLHTATVSSKSTFSARFTAASLPDMAIMGVRFNGAGYDVVPYPFSARMAPGERKMTVTIAADKPRYEPGDTATVTVRTLDRNGRPVAASVFVRAVDEKLYAIGAAQDDDPLAQLYASVGDGVIGSARSHKLPAQDWGGGGGGDTTGGGGGGERSDFRDWLVAKVVQTGANGTATVSIPLSDDLTSWRVAATAVDKGLDAGAATAKLQVGLPFFVDTVLAPEFLVSDHPAVRVRALGTTLTDATRVTFTVSSDTLPMTAATVTATGFDSAYLPLPALSAGTHRLRISASATVGGKPMQDTMVRTFTVVDRRATQVRTTWSLLAGPTAVQAGAAATQLVLVDAGRGRVVPLLEELACDGSVRADQALASALAKRVLSSAFRLPAEGTPDPGGLDPYRVNDGLAIVPWGSVNLDVTALAALADDPRLSAADLRTVLNDTAHDPAQALARRYLALAGLAALGEPVAADIAHAAATPQLTVEEQVNLALAALAAGDETLAGRLEQQLIAGHGSRYGHQVRIDPGAGVDMTVTTARLAIVAASLGDPAAGEMDEYVAAHPSATTLVVLERALAARGWAARVPTRASSATLTVDGQASSVSLAAGQSASYELTPAQARAASVAPGSGSVLVVQTWDAPLDAATLTTPDGVTVTRMVSPTGPVPATGTVIVTYSVTVHPERRGVGWQLVDFVPSGLAPIDYLGTFADQNGASGFVSPSSIDGQRVAFLMGFDPKHDTYLLRYVARVVSPGQYTWEPAVAQSIADPTDGLTLPGRTLTIQTPGG